MSKLDELIKELCSNGVEYKELGECCEFNRGSSITKASVIEGNVPVIAGGQKPAYYHNVSNRDVETIVIAGSGAYAGFVSYWTIPIFVSDAFTINPNDRLITKYLYHFLKNMQEEIHDLKKGGGVPHVYGKDLARFKIPIPPLEVQKEIVNILDKFVKLEAELEAELEARKIQYEFYRGKMLNDNLNTYLLNEICEYSKDRISSDELNEDNYIGVDNLLQYKRGKQKSSCIPQSGNWTKYIIGDVLIGNIRPYLRKIWLADNDGGTNGDVLAIRIKNNDLIIPRYLYYVLSSEDFFEYNTQYSKGAKMPRGDKTKIMEYMIPVTPLEKQNKIVEILDKFDTLINDISEGLPAEIKMRREQYEYYRDKLLNFEEVCNG